MPTQPTQPTEAQVKTWESFKGVAHRADLETRAAMIRFNQVKLLYEFQMTHDLPVTFDQEQLSREARLIYDRNERIKKAIEQVELGNFGLRFRANEMDIMAPSGTSGDMIAPYQFSGWFVFIAGVVVAYAIIEIIADQRQRAYDTYRKCTNIIEHGDEQLCADPSSQTCTDWRRVKIENDIEEQNGNIAGLFNEAKNWPEKVKNWLKAAGSGIAIAAVIVAGFLLWQRKNQ
jgi:hypothetical protein